MKKNILFWYIQLYYHLVLACFLFDNALGLDCYRCSSATNSKCGDPFTPDTISTCTTDLSGSAALACIVNNLKNLCYLF